VQTRQKTTVEEGPRDATCYLNILLILGHVTFDSDSTGRSQYLHRWFGVCLVCIFCVSNAISSRSRSNEYNRFFCTVAEYLLSVEDYLQNCLSSETLTTAAQIKRRHLLDKFYALRVNPPSVTRNSSGHYSLLFQLSLEFITCVWACFFDVVMLGLSK